VYAEASSLGVVDDLLAAGRALVEGGGPKTANSGKAG
jgi:hypothetical protein